MNKEQLWRKAASVTGDIEQRRWELAKLADEAAEANIEGYAEIIGDACRRAPSTVYEWRRAYRVRKSINNVSGLALSFWVSAANALTKDNEEEIISWIAECEGDMTITLESARAHLPHKKGEPDLGHLPAAPTLRETLIQIGVQVQDAYDATTIGAIRGLLADVKRDLKMAADWAAESEATSPDAEQVRV